VNGDFGLTVTGWTTYHI